ncbi:hypothetical protein SK128_009400 [Halocaridina rubra]|uniref:Uncharacterized protein n=1 Tax=Halocaridina rubra TaxID=373956 RepID=A0AAN9A654_HALRR
MFGLYGMQAHRARMNRTGHDKYTSASKLSPGKRKKMLKQQRELREKRQRQFDPSEHVHVGGGGGGGGGGGNGLLTENRRSSPLPFSSCVPTPGGRRGSSPLLFPTRPSSPAVSDYSPKSRERSQDRTRHPSNERSPFLGASENSNHSPNNNSWGNRNGYHHDLLDSPLLRHHHRSHSPSSSTSYNHKQVGSGGGGGGVSSGGSDSGMVSASLESLARLFSCVGVSSKPRPPNQFAHRHAMHGQTDNITKIHFLIPSDTSIFLRDRQVD